MTQLFVDIETLPGPTMPNLDDIAAPKNYKNAEKILAYKEDNQEKLWKKEALLSHKGRILCIGYAINDEPVQCLYDGWSDEEALMKKFNTALSSIHDNVDWIGKSTQFDCMFLYQRAVKYKCASVLAHLNPTTRQNIKDITWDFGRFLDYRYMVSLDDMAHFFNVESSKEIMRGSEVFDYWMAGKHALIEKYNKADVELTRILYNKIVHGIG